MQVGLFSDYKARKVTKCVMYVQYIGESRVSVFSVSGMNVFCFFSCSFFNYIYIYKSTSISFYDISHINKIRISTVYVYIYL